MSGREPPLPADPDDWFGGTVAVHDQRGVDNDWLDNQPRSPRPQREIYGVDLRLWLAGAGILAVLVVAGLAVGGVFSGGTRHPASTPPVRTPTTTPTRTPTKAAAKAPAAPATTLKPGDTGVEVKRLQRDLAFLRYSVGKIDGDYGAATQAALEKFQQAKKLDADGVLGPKTLAALKLALQRTRSE